MDVLPLDVELNGIISTGSTAGLAQPLSQIELPVGSKSYDITMPTRVCCSEI
jgi:hypothetical protein